MKTIIAITMAILLSVPTSAKEPTSGEAKLFIQELHYLSEKYDIIIVEAFTLEKLSKYHVPVTDTTTLTIYQQNKKPFNNKGKSR